jgi:hypothetical protein
MNNYFEQSRGYGMYVAGADANVGTGYSLWGIQNQLGVALDRANYGNTWTQLGGDSNASDPCSGTVNPYTIGSCVETNGNTICSTTAAMTGWVEGDWAYITGNSVSGMNNLWEYAHLVDSTHFQIATGLSYSQTGTGGTVAACQGAHAWATASPPLLAGGIVIPQVNNAHLTNPYQEGTNGKSIIASATVDDGKGYIGSVGGFIAINNGVNYFRTGTVNNVQNPPYIRNANGWSTFNIKNVNPNSGN